MQGVSYEYLCIRCAGVIGIADAWGLSQAEAMHPSDEVKGQNKEQS